MRARRSAVSNAMGWACLHALVLGGCGGKSLAEVPLAQRDTSAIFGGGTRLKAHYLDGGGGARELVDFYDTELKTSCQFVESVSGQYHCLPATRAWGYFDEACTEPAYVAPRDCGQDPPVPGQLVRSLSPECDALASGYSLAEEREVSVLYSRTREGCKPSITSTTTAWSLEKEPLTRFVQGTLSVVGANGGLQANRITGDDGAFSNFRLVAEGEPCSQVTVRGVPRCMRGLSAGFTGTNFDSTSCDGRVASRLLTDEERCAGQRAGYVAERRRENCIENDSLFAAVDDVSGAIYELDQSRQCVASSSARVSENESFYHSGAELSAEGAPKVDIARVGTGALGLPCQVDREGVPLLAPDAHNPIPQNWLTESGRKCGPIADPGGTRRCVPFALAVPTPIEGELGPFSDANCTQRVVSVLQDKCSTETLPYPYFTETASATSCTPTITHAYRAIPYAGPLFEMRDAVCVLGSSWPGELYFVMGSEVDLASFPTLSDVTEQ